MKKRILALVLLSVMALSLTAQAVGARFSDNYPELEISGTTATCSAVYKSDDSTDSVKIILTLWCGENIVDSWTKTGKGRVVMSETCRVVKGNTYDLVMMPVVNGVAKSTVTVSADS